jgi:tight adherence protein B
VSAAGAALLAGLATSVALWTLGRARSTWWRHTVLGRAVGDPVPSPVWSGLPEWLGRRRSIERDLPVAVDLVAASVRSGHGVVEALGVAASGVGGPFEADVAALTRRIERGATTEEALEWWASRRRVPGVGALVLTCRVGLSMGRGLPEALDALAATMSVDAGLDGQRRSASTQALTSAVVMVALPVVVALSGLGRLAGSLVGLASLAMALALDAVGAVWMWRLIRTTR